MTARQVFEGMLIELAKVNAPSLLLSEFNYYFNKAINNYINQRYNIYDVNLLTTDDIRVLKSTAILDAKQVDDNTYHETAINNPATSYLSKAHDIISKLLGATYEVHLPADYLHLLNCICIYKVKKNWKCYDAGSYVLFGAKRLTADSWGTILNDFYNRPLPERPYYYIHNVNTNSANTIPTSPRIFKVNGELQLEGTDMFGHYKVTTNGSGGSSNAFNTNDTTTFGESDYTDGNNVGSNFERVLSSTKSETDEDGKVTSTTEYYSTVEKSIAYRYGNASAVRMEIRYGRDNSVFELVEVQVDYIKAPQYIRLTQEMMDLTEDTSQIMEFPDYVCQEIINELTKLVMVRTGDPTLNNFIPVNTTIPSAAQTLLAQSALALAQ